MHATAVPAEIPAFFRPPVPPPCPRAAALRLIRDAAERPRHAVWHCREFYADRAKQFTGRRALDEAKRDLYVLLATSGSEDSGADRW